MNNYWRIARYEYRRNVFKKSFLMTLLSIPLMVSLGLGSGFVMVSLENNDLPVGYIDRAGIFEEPIPAPVTGTDKPVEFIAFQTEDEALASLEAKQLQAFYLIPADYLDTRQIELVYAKRPAPNANRQWYDFFRINLLDEQPIEIAYRTATGPEITTRSLDGKRSVSDNGPTFGNLMPLFIAMAFLALILISSGYLMGAVAEEKENRTMEIVVTSTSPLELIGGKLMGIVAIGLTVLASWTLIVAAGIFIARLLEIDWFQNLGMDWSVILATAAIAVPSYVLVGALMIAIGTMVTSTQEGQSFSSIFIIGHLVPLYVAFAFVNQPNGTLAVTLSLLPFTSMMTIAMRNLFYSVPTWQVIVSVCVQTLSAVFAVWLASRSFRLGMLRYGQRLSWRGLFQLNQTGE